MNVLTTRTAVGAALLILISACSSGGVTNQGASDFSKTIERSGTQIIDVRTPDEFSQGHISGAINIDVEDASFESKIATLDKSVTYAVYCHSGRRSAIATTKMSSKGFTSLFNLDGGIGAWQANGGALVTS